MEKTVATVTIKNLQTSAQKLRLVVNTIRGADVVEARATLKFLNKKASKMVLKGLNSAVANAKEVLKADAEDLVISHASVDEAPTIKRGRAASRGRYVGILKRRANLNLEVSRK